MLFHLVADVVVLHPAKSKGVEKRTYYSVAKIVFGFSLYSWKMTNRYLLHLTARQLHIPADLMRKKDNQG